MSEFYAFAVGAGVGICATVPLMLRWHFIRVRELWHRWTGAAR